jgi:N-acetylglucosaminyldiphosphoundecaprenol N-acetyl-beta-D-mannosaminyltransferase
VNHAADPMKSTEICGVPLALTDYEHALDWIDEAIREDDRRYVCVAAVHTVMLSREDPELFAAVRHADMVVPDGQPLVWAINMLGGDLRSRVYGPDLMKHAFDRAQRTGTRMYLYGHSDESHLATLVGRLRERFPGAEIAGTYAPEYRRLSAVEQSDVAAVINAARPDVVWVGLGVPLQEKWMATMRDQIDAPVLIGVGAAFDFHAGLVPQAPPWMQRRGLEWAFRLWQEPGRLWKRYLKYNPLFVWCFARQYASLAVRRRRNV